MNAQILRLQWEYDMLQVVTASMECASLSYGGPKLKKCRPFLTCRFPPTECKVYTLETMSRSQAWSLMKELEKVVHDDTCVQEVLISL